MAVDLWDLFLTGEAFELRTRRRADEAVQRAQGLSTEIAELHADLQDQVAVIHRLQVAVRVLGQLLMEHGALEPDGMEARINAALQAELAARAEARRASEAAAQARHERAERAKQAA